MLINHELLSTFITVAEEATFAAAAKRRQVTTSAVSQQMKALEGQLGVALFERVGRRARLTDAGRALAAAVKDPLAAVDAAVEAIATGASEVRGRVAIGAPRPFASVWLRPRLRELVARFPGVVPEVSFDVPSALEARLVRGDLDLAVLARAPEAGALDHAVVHVESFVLVGAPSLLARAGTPRSADELARREFVAFDHDLPMHAPFWRAAFGGRSAPGGRVIAYVASLDEMRALAVAGVALSVLPDYFVEEAIRERALVAVDVGRGRAKSPLHLAWRRAAARSGRTTAVRDLLLAEGRPRG